MKTNIYEFTDQSKIDDESIDWLVILDRDTAPSEKELSELTQWLGRSPAHRKALSSLNAFWGDNSLNDLMVPVESTYKEPKVEDTKVSFWALLSEAILGKKLVMGAVTSFALSAFILVTYILPLSENASPLITSNGVYFTNKGQQKSSTLADGSIVYLNTDSKIKVEYTSSVRNITLVKGEAHFDVAHNKEIPFRVYGAQGRVEAVGTAFTVRLNEQALDVLVTEGKVALASQNVIRTNNMLNDLSEHDSELISIGTLKAGQRAVIDTWASVQNNKIRINETARQLISQEEMQKLESWRSGYLVFSGESLDKVITEISRFTNQNIGIVDPAIKSIEIGGRFNINEIDEVFNALEANFPVDVSHVNYNEIQISSKK